MGNFGIEPQLIYKELIATNLKISSQPDELGRFPIDFDGTEEELLKQLNCIRLDDALKRFNNIRNNDGDYTR